MTICEKLAGDAKNALSAALINVACDGEIKVLRLIVRAGSEEQARKIKVPDGWKLEVSTAVAKTS